MWACPNSFDDNEQKNKTLVDNLKLTNDTIILWIYMSYMTRKEKKKIKQSMEWYYSV